MFWRRFISPIRRAKTFWHGPGTYYWQASYSGDGENRPATSPCGDTVLVVNTPPPSTHTLWLDFYENEIETHVGRGTADLSPDNSNPRTLRSPEGVVVGSGGSWLLSLRLTGPDPFSGARVQVDVWTSSSSCAAMPSNTAANYVAGTLSPHEDLTSSSIPQTAEIALSNNGNFSPSASSVTLCLRVSNVDGNNGGPHHIVISGSSDTYLSEPFEP